MEFSYSIRNLDTWQKTVQRLFEILPGLASWTILAGMLILSFVRPLTAAIFVIAFDFYWLLRLLYATIFLILSYFRLSVEEKTDWMARVSSLDRLGQAAPVGQAAGGRSNSRHRVAGPADGGSYAPLQPDGPDDFNRAAAAVPGGNGSPGMRGLISHWIYLRELEILRKAKAVPPPSKDIRHLVILPVTRENREIMEPGLQSLAHQKFPPERMLIVIALEERASPEVKAGIHALEETYRASFLDLLVVEHPDGVAGEARVKGANVTFAARAAAEFFEKKKIPSENVIASCFDADTVVSPDYFSCLTYSFMACPERTQASFQPIPVYHNNIWEAPGFSRVLEMGSSFFQLSEATNPDKLVTFSSHSMSFKALVDVGYWPVDMISDDSAIFWKAFIHFDGRYRVVPMYVTLSMDVVDAGTWWKTAVSVYKQKRRWAWGIENFPIVMRAFLRADKIPLYDKIRHGFKLFEGHIAWATWPFFVTVIGWLPAIFARREFASSVFYYSAPRITAIIFNLASLALVTTIVLSLLLLPKKKVPHPLIKRFVFACEWLLVPGIVTLLSAMPALDAQTRLMLGKRMTFWVTEKKR